MRQTAPPECHCSPPSRPPFPHTLARSTNGDFGLNTALPLTLVRPPTTMVNIKALRPWPPSPRIRAATHLRSRASGCCRLDSPTALRGRGLAYPWQRNAAHDPVDQRFQAIHLGYALPELFVRAVPGSIRFGSPLHAPTDRHGAFDHASVVNANVPESPAILWRQRRAAPRQNRIHADRSKLVFDNTIQLLNRLCHSDADMEATAGMQSHCNKKRAAGPQGRVPFETAIQTERVLKLSARFASSADYTAGSEQGMA
jgi:hypothetical protein